MTVEELHAEMQAGFARIENRIETGEAGIRAEMSDLKRDLKRDLKSELKRDLKRELSQEFRRELTRELQRHEAALRTHFDVMVERMQDSVKIVAEATAHHAVRLEDHDKRITRLEGRRRT